MNRKAGNSRSDNSELVSLVKDIDMRLRQLWQELAGVKQRLLTLERRDRILASPPQTIPAQRDSDEQLGAYDYEFLTPAVRQTYEIVAELTENPGKWVSIDDIVANSPRSRPTESAYLKTLYRAGYLKRRAQLEKKPGGRKVRKFAYRPRT